jgi:hypothetical protein
MLESASSSSDSDVNRHIIRKLLDSFLNIGWEQNRHTGDVKHAEFCLRKDAKSEYDVLQTTLKLSIFL